MLTDELAQVNTRRLAAGFVSNTLPQFAFARTRTAALRALGIRLGAHSLVMGALRVTGMGDHRKLLSFGENVVVTGPLHVDLGGAVRIGNDVFIGHDVALLTVDHAIGPAGRRCAEPRMAPIEIGEGVWLASRVTVLPGVSIGAGTVVAAGAVVTRDVGPNLLVGGVPARRIRGLDVDGASSFPDSVRP